MLMMIKLFTTMFAKVRFDSPLLFSRTETHMLESQALIGFYLLLYSTEAMVQHC